MAAVESLSTAADIVSSLTVDEIPAKLRCAGCNKLAVDAFRLPCCDQSICGKCQTTLPAACPVCEHKPISAEDCKPNKALRTTMKAFLRTEEKKRELVKGKGRNDVAAITPAISATPVSATATMAPPGEAISVATSAVISNDTILDGTPNQHPSTRTDSSIKPALGEPEHGSSESQKDVPRPSIEEPGSQQIQVTSEDNTEGIGLGNIAAGSAVGEANRFRQGTSHQSVVSSQTEGQGQAGQWDAGQIQSQMFNGGFGFNGAVNGNSNMGWNGLGEYNQMMPSLPNGMPSLGWGQFPNVMGISGVPMDPMAMSQGMYGGFGGQGMGMNGMSGMNMGMGFNAGQGGYNGWNGQNASWNGGQDKFNPNAIGGHGNGDFGTNYGYHSVPPGGGYNLQSHHGNFSQLQHQQYPNNDFQNGVDRQGFQQRDRGRGRGRGFHTGGRGQGSHNQAFQGNSEPFQHQLPADMQQQTHPPPPPQQQAQAQSEPDTMRTEPDTKASTSQQGAEGAGAADGEQSEAKVLGETSGDADMPTVTKEPETQDSESIENRVDAKIENEETKPRPIEVLTGDDDFVLDLRTAPEDTLISPMTVMPPPSGPAVPLGPAALYQGDGSQEFSGRGRGNSRGYFRSGPEYRAGPRGRGSMFHNYGNNVTSSPIQAAQTTVFPGVVPTEPKGVGVVGAPKAPKALREGLPNTGIRGGRGFSIVGRASYSSVGSHSVTSKQKSASPNRQISVSRSRTRSRSRESRQSRHRRHRHRSPSLAERDSERERRRERHQRRSRKYDDADGTDDAEGKEHRSRESSIESSYKRSSHRKRHESDRRSSHKHRSSHRSHRDRSREHRHRRDRSRSPMKEDIPKDKTTAPVIREPPNSTTTDKDSSSIKHRDRDRDRKRSRRDRSETLDASDHDRHRSRRSKRSDIDKDISTEATPVQDPHTLEREARNRERMLKEQQRRESLDAEREKRDLERIQRAARVEEDGTGGGDEAKGKVKRRQSRVEDGGGAKKGRRVSYKYEDDESDEARALRVENERESSRWG